MYADRKLIEKLLFEETQISNRKIAEAAGIKSETTVRNFRNGDASLDNLRLKNAEALTQFAEEKVYGYSDTEEKIDWLLDQYDSAGIKLSKYELIKKMTDNYYELAKGQFIKEICVKPKKE
ncbi:AsnC family protein [Enterococcus wangshanyuanii]|uniref:HTH cro/C1-type domain-containing protein n=1 Tax=Enterococcus wangshanyuanii TaxID=2005703 RepID=A0ABQ1PTV3_9ENTE|nr:hypothetical protein [Enterococcus wangshanyuanii]GGD03555.1 hypothetical protein GCM10011573_36260 [Enterococcus wangshanyuanii]